MAKYSAIKAAVNAYIKQNGRKEITGKILNAVLNATIDSLGKFYQFAGEALPTDDPGTPDQNLTYLAGTAGTYTNFGGLTLDTQEIALLMWDGEWKKQTLLFGIQEVDASVDNQVGTPSVDVDFVNNVLTLSFHNIKGDKGDTGDPAGFGQVTASVDDTIGNPSVQVQTSGEDTAKNIAFEFHGLRGETGITSVVVSVDNTTGNPACSVSLVGQVLHLDFTGLKGLKGDTGVSADYPITIYNGLDSDATDQALSAAQGKVLDGKVSQLRDEVMGINYEGAFIITSTGEHEWTKDRITFPSPIPAGEYIFKVEKGTTNNAGPVLFGVKYAGASSIINIGRADIGSEVVLTPTDAMESIGIYMSRNTNQSTGSMPLIIESTADSIKKDIGELQRIVIDDVDETPVYGSEHLAKSGGIFTELQKRLGLKEVDATSTSDIKNNYYILYSDGTKSEGAPAGAYTLRFYNCQNISHILCRLGHDNNGFTCAIAFYSSALHFSSEAIIGEYMKSHSIPAVEGVNLYEADIPAAAKYVCIINRGATYDSPVVLFYSNEQVSAGAVAHALAEKSYKISQRGYGTNPFRNTPYYYHYSANDFIKVGDYGSGVNAIASESLDDIGIAARLGFEYIEANIHKTSDDNFVVIHGSSGNFGQEVKAVDESVITTEALQATAINSKSLAWIKENVIYNSYYAKYQTTIPSLEEFCACCKENNIGIFAGTSDENAITLLQNYLGENIILYNPGSPIIRQSYAGWVFIWNNDASSTISSLLETADSYGGPFMLGIGVNVIISLRQSDALNNLIHQMHEKGYMIGFVEDDVLESEARALFKAGMDFAAAGHSVNPFEANYEIFDIDDVNYLPTTTGELSNGVVELTTGETISCGSEDTISVGKGCLRIRFNGNVSINFGSYGIHYRSNLSSDGSNLIVINDYFFRKNTHLVVTALGNTTITEFVYKTSRC